MRSRNPSRSAGVSWVGRRDIRQIEAIAKEFDMDPQERREFGD